MIRKWSIANQYFLRLWIASGNRQRHCSPCRVCNPTAVFPIDVNSICSMSHINPYIKTAADLSGYSVLCFTVVRRSRTAICLPVTSGPRPRYWFQNASLSFTSVIVSTAIDLGWRDSLKLRQMHQYLLIQAYSIMQMNITSQAKVC